MKTIKWMILVMIAASFTAVNAQKKVDPVGTWTYTASNAPYEYSSGDVIVTKEGKEFQVQIVLGEYYKVKAENVNYEKNELSFKVYIESETVSVKLNMEKDKAEGTASYTEGAIPVSVTRKE